MTTSMNSDAGRAEPFTTEQNDAVYQRLVSGDEKARDEMIEGNIALVVYRVDKYLRTSPQMTYYRDDMISAGLVGLCEAVDYMQRVGPVKTRKPTGYITKTIDQRIVQVADEANTIIVPGRVQRRARAEGKPITPPRVVSDKAMSDLCDSGFTDHSSLELQEEIAACCRSDVDRQVVMMRSKGYTDAEVGTALNMSAMTISRRRDAIEKRLLERCPEYKETQRVLAKRAAKKAAREAKRKIKKKAKQ